MRFHFLISFARFIHHHFSFTYLHFIIYTRALYVQTFIKINNLNIYNLFNSSFPFNFKNKI